MLPFMQDLMYHVSRYERGSGVLKEIEGGGGVFRKGEISRSVPQRESNEDAIPKG